MIDGSPARAAVFAAIASAALFGASTPIAKTMLGTTDPWLLAALLYLGSGLGLAIVGALGRRRSEAPLRRADLPWLALIVLSGGIAGPVLLMIGLATTAASSVALLLNLEGLATMAIAWLWFRENVDRRLLAGAFAILAGAAILGWPADGGGAGLGWGAVCVAGACLAWGIDNNLTRKLSAADPVQIATIKGLAAGGVNLVLALSLGAALPGPLAIAGAATLGFVGYGLSLVLFVLALRHLGTARTGAYYTVAPFVGAVASIAFLGEPLTLRLAVAAALMAVGVWLHLTERHEHDHRHDPLAHEHAHRHDAHHHHAHGPGDPPGEPHVHPHRHAPLKHRHVHYPDIHHRHSH